MIFDMWNRNTLNDIYCLHCNMMEFTLLQIDITVPRSYEPSAYKVATIAMRSQLSANEPHRMFSRLIAQCS